MCHKGELLFEGTNFKSFFKQDLIIERAFLEYDEIPLLCQIDSTNMRIAFKLFMNVKGGERNDSNK